jgi:type VI secretion system secreted protein Hcp
VRALQAENASLREELARLKEARGISRKVLLTGGAGVAAAGAAMSLVTPPSDAIAAPTLKRADSIPPVGGSSLPTQFYLQIVGAAQGRFTGDLDGDGLPDLMVGHKLDSRASTATSIASGLPTGRRIWKPFTIVKEWGASSPQLARALATNENLLTVDIFLQKQLSTGGSALVFKIEMTNAHVVRFRQYIGDPATEPELATQVLEEVAFTFQKIQWTSISGKTSFQDTWQAVT